MASPAPNTAISHTALTAPLGLASGRVDAAGPDEDATCDWTVGPGVRDADGAGDAGDGDAGERKTTPFPRRTDWRGAMSTSCTSTSNPMARAAADPAASPMIMYWGSIRIEANATWLPHTLTGTRRVWVSDLSRPRN